MGPLFYCLLIAGSVLYCLLHLDLQIGDGDQTTLNYSEHDDVQIPFFGTPPPMTRLMQIIHSLQKILVTLEICLSDDSRVSQNSRFLWERVERCCWNWLGWSKIASVPSLPLHKSLVSSGWTWEAAILFKRTWTGKGGGFWKSFREREIEPWRMRSLLECPQNPAAFSCIRFQFLVPLNDSPCAHSWILMSLNGTGTQGNKSTAPNFFDSSYLQTVSMLSASWPRIWSNFLYWSVQGNLSIVFQEGNSSLIIFRAVLQLFWLLYSAWRRE